jgi:hypothetical protein
VSFVPLLSLHLLHFLLYLPKFLLLCKFGSFVFLGSDIREFMFVCGMWVCFCRIMGDFCFQFLQFGLWVGCDKISDCRVLFCLWIGLNIGGCFVGNE